jgi:hypothetical protein
LDPKQTYLKPRCVACLAGLRVFAIGYNPEFEGSAQNRRPQASPRGYLTARMALSVLTHMRSYLAMEIVRGVPTMSGKTLTAVAAAILLSSTTLTFAQGY